MLNNIGFLGLLVLIGIVGLLAFVVALGVFGARAIFRSDKGKKNS